MIRTFTPAICLYFIRRTKEIYVGARRVHSDIECFIPSITFLGLMLFNDIISFSIIKAVLQLILNLLKIFFIYMEIIWMEYPKRRFRLNYPLDLDNADLQKNYGLYLLVTNVALGCSEYYLFHGNWLGLPGFLAQLSMLNVGLTKITSPGLSGHLMNDLKQYIWFNELMKRFNFEWLHPDGQLNRLYNEKVVSKKQKKAECLVCYGIFTNKRLINLGCCGNSMCYMCLYQYIRESVNDATGTNLECPFNPEECAFISERVLAKVFHKNEVRFDTVDILKKLEKARVRKALAGIPNVVHCPSPDCTNAYFSEVEPVDESFLLEPDTESVSTKSESVASSVNQVKRRSRNSKFKFFSRKKKSSFEIQNTTGARLSSGNKIDLGSLEDMDRTRRAKVPNIVRHSKGRFPKFAKAAKSVKPIYRTTPGGEDARKFKCGQCRYTYCVVCKAPWTHGIMSHHLISCDEYKGKANLGEDEKLTKAEIKNKMRLGLIQKCPSCRIHIEKNKGCKHMTCKHCNYQFCWKCHRKWRTCPTTCN